MKLSLHTILLNFKRQMPQRQNMSWHKLIDKTEQSVFSKVNKEYKKK